MAAPEPPARPLGPPPWTWPAALRTSLALNPVTITWAGNLVLVLLAGFGLHLDRVQAGAVTVVLSGLTGVITGLTARPWFIPGITGGTAAVLSACAAFGLHLTGPQVTAVTAALSAVLMLLTHSAVVPVAAARLGTTATALLVTGATRPANGRHANGSGQAAG